MYTFTADIEYNLKITENLKTFEVYKSILCLAAVK